MGFIGQPAFFSFFYCTVTSSHRTQGSLVIFNMSKATHTYIHIYLYIYISVKHATLIVLCTSQVQQRELWHWYSWDDCNALAWQVCLCLGRPLYPSEQIKRSSICSGASRRWGSLTLTICPSDRPLAQNSWKPETWGVHHEFILVRRKNIFCHHSSAVSDWNPGN